MLEDDLYAILDPVLRPMGSAAGAGEEYREPPLDVRRYYARPVRLSRLPVLGRALSVVAVVRQPVDLSLAGDGYRTLLRRTAMAAGGRYPPLRRGLSIGLTAVVLTPEPIGPEDDAALRRALGPLARTRAVPLGLFRLNLGQEALSLALARGPDGLFPEPEALADSLTGRFRRFVPLLGEGGHG
jgi:hypothetical protein